MIIATLRQICENYHTKIAKLEREKIDYEYEVDFKDLEARTSVSFSMCCLDKNIKKS